MATNRRPSSPAKTLSWLPVLSAHIEATATAIDECIAVLERDGESDAAWVLRREFGRLPADHACTFRNGNDCDCGASR